MEETDKPFTHNAWIMKQEGVRRGRRFGRWINEGTVRVGSCKECSAPFTGTIDVYIHSLPVGGFNGWVHCAPLNEGPPEPTPQRPGGNDESEGEAET